MASKSRRASLARRRVVNSQSVDIWQRGKWWFIGLGMLGAVAVLVVLTFAFSGPQTTGSESIVRSGIGPSVFDFPVDLYQGDKIVGSKNLQFSELLGDKPIVLNYWASNCPPCSAEMPEFQKVSEAYAGKVLFFGLDVGRFAGYGGPDESRRELKRLGVTYPAAPVPDLDTVRSLRVRALPSTDFITPDGTIHRQWVGSLNEDGLTKIVEDLLEASTASSSKDDSETGSLEVGEAIPTLPASHSPPYAYNSRPPTSGPHLSSQAPYGISTTPLVAEAVVHDMEHGAVVIWFQPGDSQLAGQVETLVNELGSRCLVAGPYSDMDYKVAVTGWGRLLSLSKFDPDSIKAFVSAYRGRLGPEAGLC